MLHGTYVGDDLNLRGKTALLMYKDDGLLAQFDDRLMFGGLAYGWHKFKLTDFTIDASPFDAPTKG